MQSYVRYRYRFVQMFKRSVVPNVPHQQVSCIIYSPRFRRDWDRSFCRGDFSAVVEKRARKKLPELRNKEEIFTPQGKFFAPYSLRFFGEIFCASRANFHGNVTLLIPTPAKRLFHSLLIFSELVLLADRADDQTFMVLLLLATYLLSLSLFFFLFF